MENERKKKWGYEDKNEDQQKKNILSKPLQIIRQRHSKSTSS